MFETKKELRERIQMLTAVIGSKEWRLTNAQKDVMYYREKMYENAGIADEWREKYNDLSKQYDALAEDYSDLEHERIQLRKENEALKVTLENSYGWAGSKDRWIKQLQDEISELKKEKNILSKCIDADNKLIDKLRKENEELKQPKAIYISTADHRRDEMLMRKLRLIAENSLYGQYGRGGFAYLEPKFEMAEPEERINFEIKPSPELINYMKNDVLAVQKLYERRRKERMAPEIDRVIQNNPATIIFWKDGTKTVVKAQGEAFDEEKGIAMAIAKKVYGNDSKYYNKIKKHLPK